LCLLECALGRIGFENRAQFRGNLYDPRRVFGSCDRNPKMPQALAGEFGVLDDSDANQRFIIERDRTLGLQNELTREPFVFAAGVDHPEHSPATPPAAIVDVSPLELQLLPLGG